MSLKLIFRFLQRYLSTNNTFLSDFNFITLFRNEGFPVRMLIFRIDRFLAFGALLHLRAAWFGVPSPLFILNTSI
jgi:hypothetical protein